MGLNVPRYHSGLRAAFYRGGTSRGLIVTASHLAAYDQATRDRILCAAMGSPDPDGRQIDGLGGGASSLSKIAIINAPGRGFVKTAAEAGNPLPGVEWADDFTQARDRRTGWDVVYRFGQVPIKSGTTVDWSTTCANLVAAVAHSAVRSGNVNGKRIDQHLLREGHAITDEFRFPLRILCANTGGRFTAHVPVARAGSLWQPVDVGSASISGVPGTAPSTIVETPLDGPVLLPTGNPRDEVTLPDGSTIAVSIVNAGLPIIFVRASDFGVDFNKLTSHPADLDSDGALGARVEELRKAASQLCSELRHLYFPGSASPKVCLLHRRAAYQSTGGMDVTDDSNDIVARAISVGQFHRTIPATVLSALGVASGFKETTVSELIREVSSDTTALTPKWAKELNKGKRGLIRFLRVGQPAGVSSTCIRVPAGASQPDAILMERTAKLIMNGDVSIPAQLMRNRFQPFVELLKSRGKMNDPKSAPTDLNALAPSSAPRVYQSAIQGQMGPIEEAERQQAAETGGRQGAIDNAAGQLRKAERETLKGRDGRAARDREEKARPVAKGVQKNKEKQKHSQPPSSLPNRAAPVSSHALQAQADLSSGVASSAPRVEEAVPVQVDDQPDKAAPSHALEAQADLSSASIPSSTLTVEQAVPVDVNGEAAQATPSHTLEAQVDQASEPGPSVEGTVPVDVSSESAGAESSPPSSDQRPSSSRAFSSDGQRRSYSTSGSASASASVAGAAPLHLFRRLSRSISRHPELRRQTKNSLRRLVKDDFAEEARIAGGSWKRIDPVKLQERVRSSLLLLLSAGNKLSLSTGSEQPSPASHLGESQRLASSLLNNLSSLSYHHLSPNTHFPSLRHPRLYGGSEGTSARSSRAKLASPPTPAELAAARAAFGAKAAEEMKSFEGIGGSQRALQLLRTVPRPVRGPVPPSGMRIDSGGGGAAAAGMDDLGESDVVREAWNGQKVRLPPVEGEKSSSTTSLAGARERLVEQIEAIKSQVDAKDAPATGGSKAPQRLRKLRSDLASKEQDLKHLSGLMKSARRVEAKRAGEVQFKRAAKEALQEVVVRAALDAGASGGGEDGESLLFGTSRWRRWYEGKFLPP